MPKSYKSFPKLGTILYIIYTNCIMDSFDDIIDIVHEFVFTTAMIKVSTPKFKKWVLHLQGIYMILSVVRLYYLLVYKKEVTITKSIKLMMLFEIGNLVFFIYSLKTNLQEIDILHKQEIEKVKSKNNRLKKLEQFV